MRHFFDQEVIQSSFKIGLLAWATAPRRRTVELGSTRDPFLGLEVYLILTECAASWRHVRKVAKMAVPTVPQAPFRFLEPMTRSRCRVGVGVCRPEGNFAPGCWHCRRMLTLSTSQSRCDCCMPCRNFMWKNLWIIILVSIKITTRLL